MAQRKTDTNPPSSVNPTPDPAREPYLGGADSVGKTTYLGDVHGTDANDAPHPPGGVNATVRHRGGLGLFGWIVLIVAALVAVAYAAGWFT